MPGGGPGSGKPLPGGQRVAAGGERTAMRVTDVGERSRQTRLNPPGRQGAARRDGGGPGRFPAG